MIIRNKKGMELALNTVVIMIILVIVLILLIWFFVGEYSQGSSVITDLGNGAVNNAIE